MSGWGTLSSGGRHPEELMEVTVTTMTNTQVETVIDKFIAKLLLQNTLLYPLYSISAPAIR